MNEARKRAARLAVYLECAGQVPIIRGSTYRDYCDSLKKQYCALELELRWYARVEGRRRIREYGLQTAAIGLIPVPPRVKARPKIGPEKRRQQRARYLEQARRWPPDSPPCPKCRTARGLPKRCWPSLEMAEAVRVRQNDPGLRVYPCPAVQAGSCWHLGHRWRRAGISLSTIEPNSNHRNANPDHIGASGESA